MGVLDDAVDLAVHGVRLAIVLRHVDRVRATIRIARVAVKAHNDPLEGLLGDYDTAADDVGHRRGIHVVLGREDALGSEADVARADVKLESARDRHPGVELEQ
eukprot:7377586-Prymnesium_polylepis.3